MRAFCYNCDEYALLVDGVYQCCDRPREDLDAAANAIEYALNAAPFSGIYRIKNTETGTVYIGQSRNVMARLLKHKELILRGTHDVPEINDDAKSYGAKSFVFEVLEHVRPEWLIQREAIAITQHACRGKVYNRSLLQTAGRPAILPEDHESREEIRRAREAEAKRMKDEKQEREALLYWYPRIGEMSLEEAREHVRDRGLPARRRRKPLK